MLEGEGVMVRAIEIARFAEIHNSVPKTYMEF